MGSGFDFLAELALSLCDASGVENREDFFPPTPAEIEDCAGAEVPGEAGDRLASEASLKGNL